MIKQNQRLLNAVNILSDGVIVLLSYLFSSWLWLLMLRGDANNIAGFHSIRLGTGIVVVLYAAVLTLILALTGLYAPIRTRRFRRDVLAIVGVNLMGTLSLGTLLYLFRVQDFSRGVLGLFCFVSLMLLCVKRVLVRHVLAVIRQKGYNQKHVIVVGSGMLARQYAASIADMPELGYCIKGYVGPAPVAEPLLQPILGDYASLDKLLREPGIDEVVIALDPDETGFLMSSIRQCEQNGTRASVIPYFSATMSAQPTINTIGSLKMISLRSNRLDNLGFAFLKRSFDITLSLLALLIASPLLLLVAVGVKLSSPGPILFKQERVGLNKQVFSMFKFRSMRVNAHETSGWTRRGDPRRTRFGALLRKLSIDELPQLINVLKGDMSLVGPRPEIPFFVDQYRESIPLYMVKHQVRPGLTGWAQVHGYRGDTSIEERIRHDIWYIENWSIALDVKIMFLTLFGGWYNQQETHKKDAHTD